MLSGYVITETGTQALDLFDRCAEGIGVNPDRTQQSAGRRADVRGNRIDESAGHLDEKEQPDHSAPSVLIRDRCAEGEAWRRSVRADRWARDPEVVGSNPTAGSGNESTRAPSVLIRYAASLDNGRGFAAYDVETLADVLELSRFGQVLSEVRTDLEMRREKVTADLLALEYIDPDAAPRAEPTCPTCGRIRERAVEHRSKVFADGSYCDDVCFAAFHAEANPDDPDSWPVWARPKGPKRQVARGDERFVLLDDAFNVREDDPIRGIARVAENPHTFYWLVETGPSWDCPLDPVWDASVVEWKDSRVEVPA